MLVEWPAGRMYGFAAALVALVEEVSAGIDFGR